MLFRPNRYQTLGNFQSRPGSVHARAAGIRYTHGAYLYEQPVLILAGLSGTGKTHLLNASAHQAMKNEYLDSCSTLSARRLANTLLQATEFGDLPFWMGRFTCEDFLALDDVDDVFGWPEASALVLELLQARAVKRHRTLLALTLQRRRNVTCPLEDFLETQSAVRLT